MARTVKEQERTARIDEILDAALSLIQGKGYAQMTIRDLLDALQISKGAFYHYFDSKQALLEALISRMVEQIMAVLRPIADDAGLPALLKLETVFGAAAGWKGERVGVLSGLLAVWYADENVLVREKLKEAATAQFAPLLRGIIAQGVAEGTMAPAYPELAGTIAIDLLNSMSNEVVQCLMHWDRLPDAEGRVSQSVAAYRDAVERLLGVTPGTLLLVDPAFFELWSAALSS